MVIKNTYLRFRINYKDEMLLLLKSINASSIYMADTNMVITVPADVLAPDVTRPSAGMVLTEKLDIHVSLSFDGFPSHIYSLVTS